MGVHRRVADWLTDHGHDVVHLGDVGLRTLSDRRIFQKAIEEGRVVLTFDLDFGEITAYAGRGRTSVVIFRLRNTRAAFVVQRLSEVLAKSSDALDEGAVVIVEDGRYRVRRFPEG